ncbi:MAG: hypothetical protein HY343_06935, partial [Lentisphaerae bacterium]|nr:hypothetical protein [Lentisphaerota bacterium]
LELAKAIQDVQKDLVELARQTTEVKRSAERNGWQLTCAGNVNAIVGELDVMKAGLEAGTLAAGELQGRISVLLPKFATMDMSLRRFFIGEIPWSDWVGPLSRWAVVIGLTYIILMAFNVLIFRQWAHNEKLTYPLAELPKALLGGVDADGGIPAVFRNGLFWIGFSVSATVMGWNLLCASNVVSGLTPFQLNENNSWIEYVKDTQFNALRSTKCVVFFTMIGLSFLVPKNISFSLWFFYLLFMGQMLLLVWSGYGQDERSFPMDWWYLLNFRTAEGQGALMIFSSVVLYKCRKYILCAFLPSTVGGLEPAERRELKVASLAFVLGSVGLILLLWKSMGANLFYTIFCYFVILVITIGLIRTVTEGGLLAFQAWSSPFHFIRAFFGLDKAWTSTSLFAPLMIFYSIIFLDIKTFIAPAMANALKLRDDFKMKRGVFHAAIFLAIAVAAVTAIVATLMTAYVSGRGADGMNKWFYTDFPRAAMLDTIRTMAKDAPAAASSHAGWVGAGAVVMGALLYFRQFVFWLPHPIGLIMLVNPLMNAMWFSILLGWMSNVVVTKYGNKDTYQRATGLFIGLIVGELLIVMLAVVVSFLTGRAIPIDLNPNM